MENLNDLSRHYCDACGCVCARLCGWKDALVLIVLGVMFILVGIVNILTAIVDSSAMNLFFGVVGVANILLWTFIILRELNVIGR
jgi:hypothetical protein